MPPGWPLGRRSEPWTHEISVLLGWTHEIWVCSAVIFSTSDMNAIAREQNGAIHNNCAFFSRTIIMAHADYS
jgi:hypothetical protein